MVRKHKKSSTKYELDAYLSNPENFLGTQPP